MSGSSRKSNRRQENQNDTALTGSMQKEGKQYSSQHSNTNNTMPAAAAAMGQNHPMGAAGMMMPMAPHPMYAHSHWGAHQQHMPHTMMGMNGQPIPPGPLHYMASPAQLSQWSMFRQPGMPLPPEMAIPWQQQMTDPLASGQSLQPHAMGQQKQNGNEQNGLNSSSLKATENQSQPKSGRKSKSPAPSKPDIKRTKSGSSNKSDAPTSSTGLKQQNQFGNMMPWAQTQLMMTGHPMAGAVPGAMMMGMMSPPDQIMMGNGKGGASMYPQHMMTPDSWMTQSMNQSRNRQGSNGSNGNMLCKPANGTEDLDNMFRMKSPGSTPKEKGRGNYRCGRVSNDSILKKIMPLFLL